MYTRRGESGPSVMSRLQEASGKVPPREVAPQLQVSLRKRSYGTIILLAKSPNFQAFSSFPTQSVQYLRRQQHSLAEHKWGLLYLFSNSKSTFLFFFFFSLRLPNPKLEMLPSVPWTPALSGLFQFRLKRSRLDVVVRALSCWKQRLHWRKCTAFDVCSPRREA